MIAKKNVDFGLLEERMIFIQTGFMVTAGLVCAAFAWRSPIVQDLLVTATVYPNETPIEESNKKQKEPEKEKIFIPVLANIAPAGGSQQLIDETTRTEKGLNYVDSINALSSTGGHGKKGTGAGFTDETNFNIGIQKPTDEIVDIPTIDAIPPMGMKNYIPFLRYNFNYPEIAIENGDEGTVHMKFIVEKNGKISNVIVVRGVSPEVDKEAIRVLKLVDNWKPAEDEGKPVRSFFNTKFKISLQ